MGRSTWADKPGGIGQSVFLRIANIFFVSKFLIVTKRKSGKTILQHLLLIKLVYRFKKQNKNVLRKSTKSFLKHNTPADKMVRSYWEPDVISLQAGNQDPYMVSASSHKFSTGNRLAILQKNQNPIEEKNI